MKEFESTYEELDDDDKKELDKFYSEFEIYKDDSEFLAYITPLLKEDSFSTEKICNLKKVLEYYEEEGIYLPLIDDPRYKFIQNYQDFEFTNCIAYEMVIRTDEFYKAKSIIIVIEDFLYIQSSCLSYFTTEKDKHEVISRLEESSQYFHKDIQEIVLKYLNNGSFQENFDEALHKCIINLSEELENLKLILKDFGILNIHSFLTQDMFDFTDGKFTLLDQIQENLTLADFDNGVGLLLKFYLPKEKIYKKDEDDVKFEKIECTDIEKTQKEILNDLKSYYIHLNSNIIQISDTMPILKFDIEFQSFIKNHYNKYKYIDTQPNYTRPALHFLNSRIINLPLNLNFTENELISLVKKIKKDYHKKTSLVKTPIEQLGEELENFKRPNSEKKLPSKDMENRKLAFANAFCVYDLDKVLTPIFDKKNKEFKKNKSTINEDNLCTKEGLKSEISFITGLEEDTVKIYRTLIKNYINGKKFIGLITGLEE